MKSNFNIFYPILISYVFVQRTNAFGKRYADILLENCPVATGYNSPNDFSKEPQNITLYFRPSRFIEINDIRESFSVLGVFQVTWNVQCVADLYKNVDGVWPRHVDYIGRLNPAEFWYPEVALSNTIGESQVLDFRRIRLWLENGMFQAISPKIFTSFCNLDFYHFPYDRQECSFHFRVVEDSQFIRLVDVKWRIVLDAEFSPHNSNWILENKSTEWQIVKPSKDAKFLQSIAMFKFQFRRVPDYYLLNLLMPSFLLALLELSSFFLTPSSTERPAYAVTIMLSVMVVQNSFLSLLPNTPKPILVAYYAAGNTIFAAFCAIYSSFLCYFINNYPKIAKRIIFNRKLYAIVDCLTFICSILYLLGTDLAVLILIQTLK